MLKLKRKLLARAAVLLVLGGAAPVAAEAPHGQLAIKTRLDHLSGTTLVLVISYLPSEITSITCDQWTMLGVGSWKHQNDFTIPAGPSIAVMDAAHFNGYCKNPGSIKAHTDDGDFVGVLDRGDGNWEASTKLTFK